MGSTTNLNGCFQLDRFLDPQTKHMINGICQTRRMKRDVSKIGLNPHDYGVEGEFYFPNEAAIIDDDKSILNYNLPPSTQPGLWCGWCYNAEKNAIEWECKEKFYYFSILLISNYIEWIQYIIKKILTPRNYILNGDVHWKGEDKNDYGTISIRDNHVQTNYGSRKRSRSADDYDYDSTSDEEEIETSEEEKEEHFCEKKLIIVEFPELSEPDADRLLFQLLPLLSNRPAAKPIAEKKDNTSVPPAMNMKIAEKRIRID